MTLFRKVLQDGVRYGRRLLDDVLRKGEPEVSKNVPKQREAIQFPEVLPAPAVVRTQGLATNGKNILQRYIMSQKHTSGLAKEMKKQFGFRMNSGSFPVFGRRGASSLRQRLVAYGFVAVGCTSTGAQIGLDTLSHDGVCGQIRDFFKENNLQKQRENASTLEQVPRVEDFEFGKLIAKGCNAAVFEAKVKSEESSAPIESGYEIPEESMSFIPIEESDDDDISIISSCHSDFTVISDDADEEAAPTVWNVDEMQEEDLVSLHSEPEITECPVSDTSFSVIEEECEFAIKVMFNYDAESNAASILREMDKELIPAKLGNSLMQMETWENGSHPKKKARRRLPPHPNMVDMLGAYVDDMPALPEAYTEYPHALPFRLNPEGFGRNQTMFLIMKRYDCTLREYLANNTLSMRENLLLFTQLIEGIQHINANGIAHRDLKSDNILLDLEGVDPQLVISDFGCCLAQDNGRMWVPYFSDQVNKGGNGSLMAPEIATAQPGWLSFLNYAKSDVWAAGALGYEIFAGNNPFYRKRGAQRALENVSYKESELPEIPEAPEYVEAILKMMLQRDPKKRPSAENVLDMLHFTLWCPPEWLVLLDRAPTSRPPSPVKIRRWVEKLAMEVALEGKRSDSRNISGSLKRQFLSRVDTARMSRSLSLLWSACR